jgi:hypothetical protein
MKANFSGEDIDAMAVDNAAKTLLSMGTIASAIIITLIVLVIVYVIFKKRR